MATPNFLLGKGEQLAKEQEPRRRGGGKVNPYDLATAKRVIGKQAVEVAASVKTIPSAACPDDEAVAVMKLHPSYLSKSSFPDELLAKTGLRAVGSRQSEPFTPRAVTGDDPPKEATSAELFVAGKRSRFADFADAIPELTVDSAIAGDIIKIEEFRFLSPPERVQEIHSKATTVLMEVVLHTGGTEMADQVRRAFEKYLSTLKISVDIENRIDAGHLSFIAVRIPKNKMNRVASFSFLRTAREMPRLRQLTPSKKQATLFDESFSCSLPKGTPIDGGISVAVFDGGCPDVPELGVTRVPLCRSLPV